MRGNCAVKRECCRITRAGDDRNNEWAKCSCDTCDGLGALHCLDECTRQPHGGHAGGKDGGGDDEPHDAAVGAAHAVEELLRDLLRTRTGDDE